MSLSNYVSLSITQDSVGVARAGFGVPLIASHNASFVERTREYTDLAGIADDGFATDSPEYLAAAAMFSQSPHPSKVKIGRLPTAPTQVYELTPTAADETDYEITVAGEGVTGETVSYTSDATGSVAEICAGLTSALNAVVGKNFTAVDNTTSVTVTGDAAGNWFSLEVGNVALIEIAQTHADPGVATDLAALALEDNDWYAIVTLYNSNAYALAVAAWVESNSKFYALDVNESDAVTTAAGNSDTLDDLATLNRARTLPCYHPSPVSFFAASWLGEMLPRDPGSATWSHKQLSGVPAVTLTATQRSNLLARNANSFETVAGVDITFFGTMSDGDYADVQRGLDWLEDDMSSGVFEAIASAAKIPYTDAGVAVIESEVRASLKRAIDRGILADDPAPTVTVPAVADVSSANKSARLLPDVKFSATLAGAIHKVTVTGVVSV